MPGQWSFEQRQNELSPGVFQQEFLYGVASTKLGLQIQGACIGVDLINELRVRHKFLVQQALAISDKPDFFSGQTQRNKGCGGALFWLLLESD